MYSIVICSPIICIVWLKLQLWPCFDMLFEIFFLTICPLWPKGICMVSIICPSTCLFCNVTTLLVTTFHWCKSVTFGTIFSTIINHQWYWLWLCQANWSESLVDTYHHHISRQGIFLNQGIFVCTFDLCVSRTTVNVEHESQDVTHFLHRLPGTHRPTVCHHLLRKAGTSKYRVYGND